MDVDQTGIDRMGIDRMGIDRMGIDRMGIDRTRMDQSRRAPLVLAGCLLIAASWLGPPAAFGASSGFSDSGASASTTETPQVEGDAPTSEPPTPAPLEVSVERDNVEIRFNAIVRFADGMIADADGNGVLQIVGRDDGAPIVVDLGGAHLVGGTGPAERHAGIGISVRGRNVTLRNGRISGFKVGIDAAQCDGLVLEDLDTSDNYAQRLRSRPWEEDLSDWLFPHANDGGEWAREHGAGVSVRAARGVTIRRITSHRTQNGILLDRVARSAIYDNDCSFLSGWGIALWRSSGNTICRNNLDFCIRGYSHGIYNRGQDSAGLLMFEQCSSNVVALNSATHCGDGVFGFAGREALGEVAKDGVGEGWHETRGSNRNVFVANDLSFAAAHGLEITFSFGNLIARNRFESNAICGVWAGYSRDTTVVGNAFVGNGRTMTGSERGGINMEHARDTLVSGNAFENEPVGVRFWTDADPHLARLPWARANGMGAARNAVESNAFTGVERPLEVFGAAETTFAENGVFGTDVAVWGDEASGPISEAASGRAATTSDEELAALLTRLPGSREAVGLRAHLRGRDRIVMLDHGPYAWDRPVIARANVGPAAHGFRLLGFAGGSDILAKGTRPVEMELRPDGSHVEIRSQPTNALVPYLLEVRDPSGATASVTGLLAPVSWKADVLPANRDVGGAAASAAPIDLAVLDLSLLPTAMLDEARSSQRLAVASRSRIRHEPGRYRLHLRHNGAVRISIDGATVPEHVSSGRTSTHVVAYAVEQARDVDFAVDFAFVGSGAGPALVAWFEHDGEGDAEARHAFSQGGVSVGSDAAP